MSRTLPPETPEARQQRRKTFFFRCSLCVFSGVMLGCSFPPIPYGILACFGLVPLLIVLADIRDMGTSLRYTYLALFVFHVITLNWTGGYAHANDVYMMIAGAATMIVHPIFYFVPVAVFVYVRRHLDDWIALTAFPFIWVGYEYLHSLSEWSFPWLTLGNSQSYDITRIQFISATGVYGLSLWIVIVNVLAYILYSKLAQRQWRPLSKQSLGLVALLLFVYYLPAVHGSIVLSQHGEDDRNGRSGSPGSINVGIIQSNVDPWEKWKLSGLQTLDLYLAMTDSLVRQNPSRKPDLVLWPETAIPFYILTEANRPALDYVKGRIEGMGVSVLTGLAQKVYYRDSTTAPRSARRDARTGERYDSFNATALIQPGVPEVSWYGKMKLVPFAERVPYADSFSFLDFLQWGVGIGGWQVGRDTTVFVERKTGARFNSLICYESTYPGFVAAFVKKGAEFITIVTIDSWWDDMSGAYQHEQFAIFRAIENRRWIARCAVGGISCYIDPYGRVYDKTRLFTQTTLLRTITRTTDLSMYTEHIDWFAQMSMLVAGLFLASAAGVHLLRIIRKR
jgi:apolipoprotein N-acyltransferase